MLTAARARKVPVARRSPPAPSQFDETHTAQLREILAGIEQTLRDHPKIWRDSVVVRFKEFGASSLDIEIMAWFTPVEWNEFTLIRQQLSIAFMEVVEPMGAETWVTLSLGAERVTGRAGPDFPGALGRSGVGRFRRGARVLVRCRDRRAAPRRVGQFAEAGMAMCRFAHVEAAGHSVKLDATVGYVAFDQKLAHGT